MTRAAPLCSILSGFAALTIGLACTPVVEPETPEPDLRAGSRPLDYHFVALDGTHVTDESMRGRVTVIVFLTTYDLSSQVVVRELGELMHSKKPRFNTLGVTLEPPKNAPLVDAFAATMELPFRLAMSPSADPFDAGPFGKVDAVPTIVILDRDGIQRFRHAGALATADLERAITRAESAAPR